MRNQIKSRLSRSRRKTLPIKWEIVFFFLLLLSGTSVLKSIYRYFLLTSIPTLILKQWENDVFTRWLSSRLVREVQNRIITKTLLLKYEKMSQNKWLKIQMLRAFGNHDKELSLIWFSQMLSKSVPFVILARVSHIVLMESFTLLITNFSQIKLYRWKTQVFITNVCSKVIISKTFIFFPFITENNWAPRDGVIVSNLVSLE